MERISFRFLWKEKENRDGNGKRGEQGENSPVLGGDPKYASDSHAYMFACWSPRNYLARELIHY